MTITQILYQILIGPLQLFFEVVYVVAYRVVHHPALAIIVLSLVMNVLVLPLYRQADALQAKERDKEMAIKPRLDRLKKAFSGDERFMVLQTFYRQNDYKPTDSLKGSISLLLEIPFFIAAYNFLSHLELLNGVPLGPIKDLGSPDGLISFGGVSVNFLPILMTTINVISAAIYMKGFPLKSKLQMYGIAIIFLVLLYNSPAGLVFYWTLNNIFSLLKNVFYKLKNAETILTWLLSISGIILLGVVLFVHPMRSIRSQVMMIGIILAFQLPLIASAMRKKNISISLGGKDSNDKVVFYASTIILTILTGLLIPTSILKGSVLEFVNIRDYSSPMWNVVSALSYAVGFFLVWFTVFYKLANDEGKSLMSFFAANLAVVSVIDYMFFGTGFGNLSSTLVYDNEPSIDRGAILLNAGVIILALAITSVAWMKKRTLIKFLTIVVCIGLFTMSGTNIYAIQAETRETKNMIGNSNTDDPEIVLSKNENNVLVIMMDRQTGFMVPYILEEKPELKKSFEGFTVYTNAISYGHKTNIGTPGLYGGYDYIPEEMNKRDTELIADKHNEALKVMPRVFGDAGYRVTLCDLSYAGYSWIPDFSIFSDHPEYNCYITIGKYATDGESKKDRDEAVLESRKRNFFCYGLFKIAPSIMQKTLYEHGNYNSASKLRSNNDKEKDADADNLEELKDSIGSQILDGGSKATGLDKGFMDSYGVLCNLVNLTTISSEKQGTFTVLCNETTHNQMMLQEPEYVPAVNVDNSEFDAANPNRTSMDGKVLSLSDAPKRIHYQDNMAAMIKLGEWFDYMKEKGVYDNTRIIIVSDHGHGLYGDPNVEQFTWTRDNGDKKAMDVTMFNCALLVKDFNSHELTITEAPITNADTPALAMTGIIEDMRNPFTNNPIRFYDGNPVNVHLTPQYKISENNGYKYMEGDWFEVRPDFFKNEDWTYLGKK